ncbi:MAG: ATP-binding protein [Thermoguttaceae bacterium]
MSLFPRTIRARILLLQMLPLFVVLCLGVATVRLIFDYRDLVQSTEESASAAPQQTQLVRGVDKLRESLLEVRFTLTFSRVATLFATERSQKANAFEKELVAFQKECVNYSKSFGSPEEHAKRDAPFWETFRAMREPLDTIKTTTSKDVWYNDLESLETMSRALDTLRSETEKLTNLLFDQLKERADATRRGSTRLLWWTVVLLGLAGGAMFLTFYLFSRWMTQPLHRIVEGSRLVAAGNLAHRIVLTSHDEMAELAEAMNEMTRRFQAISDDLNRQVRERTAEALQNERLASVGFLAAGVAHEINNPLAAIAMCAESLQKQIDIKSSKATQYLRVIQDEAFRCQGITERLLGLARAPSGRCETVALAPLVEDMITIITTQGQYRNKEIVLDLDSNVSASVSPQEIKQVILNLLTNACEATGDGGRIVVALANEVDNAILTVTDNGCGMNVDVLKNVFEPFFTQRRGGKPGTGLGLSISHRIVADHGGSLTAMSTGEGDGATFTVKLPVK